MKKMTEAIDYEFVVSEKDKNSIHIKLLTGEYKDVLYKYGKVGFKEEENDVVYLQFDFDVISSPIKKVEKDENFRNYIGDILTQIITGNLEIDELYLYLVQSYVVEYYGNLFLFHNSSIVRYKQNHYLRWI
jgi:hypothetical protein